MEKTKDRLGRAVRPVMCTKSPRGNPSSLVIISNRQRRSSWAREERHGGGRKEVSVEG